MPLRLAVPPGRAGRIWLRRRLGTAERGRGQLDRKLRILLPERERLQLQAARQRAEWVDAVTRARVWLDRLSVLGGQDAVRSATTPVPTEIEILAAGAMGLSYPGDAALTTAPAERALPGNAAVAPAVAAFRDALLAGARTAAAEEAVRRLEIEIALCRRRLRALDKRWLPLLRDTLVALELGLDQAEQEDHVRLRQAASAQPGSGSTP